MGRHPRFLGFAWRPANVHPPVGMRSPLTLHGLLVAHTIAQVIRKRPFGEYPVGLILIVRCRCQWFNVTLA